MFKTISGMQVFLIKPFLNFHDCAFLTFYINDSNIFNIVLVSRLVKFIKLRLITPFKSSVKIFFVLLTSLQKEIDNFHKTRSDRSKGGQMCN